MNQNWEWEEYFKNDDIFAFQFIINPPRYGLQVTLSWFRRLVPKYRKECVLPTSDSVHAYWTTNIATCVRADWLPTFTEVQEDPSVQYQRPIRFTGMTPCLYDMLIHNLTHLFNAVGKIVWLKLIPKAPTQRRKRLFLDDYLIHRALGAKPEQWKTFATRCYIPKHVYIIWIIPVHNSLLLQTS